MNWKQLTVRIIATAAATCATTRLAWAQSCYCQGSVATPGTSGASNTFRAAEFATPQTTANQLPTGWPKQWSAPGNPAVSDNPAIATHQDERAAKAPIRDPFTGTMVASTAQARWDRAITTSPEATSPGEASSSPATQSGQPSTPSAQQNAKTSYSILPSPSGSAIGATIGGAIGSGGGTGGAFGGASSEFGGAMGGGSGGGGMGGGASSWSPSSIASGSGAAGGGFSDRSASGTLRFQTNSDQNSNSSTSGHQTSTSTHLNTELTDSGSSSTPPLTSANSDVQTKPSSNGGGSAEIEDPIPDVPVVIAPEPAIPDYTPEIPTNEHPSPDCRPALGTSSGETPIVPEPGSIILLVIALAGAGAMQFRNRKQGLRGQIPPLRPTISDPAARFE